MTDMFDQHKELVKEFYETAGIKHPLETHIKLIDEEAKEVLKAAEAFLKELADMAYVLIGAQAQLDMFDMPEDVHERVSSSIQFMHLIPLPILDEAFRRVHESNMSKLVDGKLMRDPETGKILKGPNYKAPDLSDLI